MYPMTPAESERLEPHLEPLYQRTGSGIEISIQEAWTPDAVAHIVFKSCKPLTAAKAAILFVPGAHLGADVYAPLSLWLAERGIETHCMSLAYHGAARLFSVCNVDHPLEQMSLTDYSEQISMVVGTLSAQRLILVGDGMSGVAVQLVAAQHPERVAGLVLLGSCLPTLAADVWSDPRPRNAPIPAPTPAEVRRWLGDASDRDVTALAELVSPESPLIDYNYGELKSWDSDGFRGPVLVMGGEHDATIQPTILQTTASAYGTVPVTITGAAHLLMWGNHWPESAERILTFCQVVFSSGGTT